MSSSDLLQLVKLPDGSKKPWGIYHYEQLVQEIYLLSKNINSSYTELLDITPTEKNLMLGWLEDEAKKQQEEIDKYNKKYPMK